MPNEPRKRISAHGSAEAYPTAEVGGLIWAYMGPAEKVPRCPIRMDASAGDYRHLSKMRQECNWLQALEGAIDNAHALPAPGMTDKTTRAGLRGYWDSSRRRGGCPSHRLRIMYTATRALPGRENYVRAYST